MAGALSRRDIEMIFRAETDKATRPIGALTKDVTALRGALESQIEAVKKGEKSLDSFADSTRQLKKVQDELGTARGLVTQLNAQEKALQGAEDRLASTSAKYAEFKTQIEGAVAPSKKLQNQFEATGRAQSAAAETLDRIKQEYTQTRASIESIIGPVDSISSAFSQIAATSREASRGIAVIAEAADNARSHLAGLSAEQAKAASDQSFQKAGSDAGLIQSQINYISQFENRIELLAAAKRELQSQDGAFNAALTAQGAREGVVNVAALKAQFEETIAAEERIKQVTAFRQIAADANAAVSDVQRFAAAEDQSASATTRFASSILSILNPTQAAIANLDGLEAAVTSAAGVLEGKGRKSAQEYNVALNGLLEAGAATGRLAQSIDAFRAQEAAVARTGAAFQAAKADALALGNGLLTAENPTKEMAQALKTAESAAIAAGNAMKGEQEKLNALAASLTNAGIDVKNLALAEQRLTAVSKETAAAQANIRKTVGGGGKGSFLGLSINDAQNLGYQINDIFTGLASGQPIMQIFAQQSGQIFQIGGVRAFLAALGPLIPLLLAIGAAAAVVVAIFERLGTVSAEQKASAAYVALLGEAGSLTADQMTKASLAMQDFGTSAADARKAVQEFSNAGLDPAYLDSYTKAARDASLVTGTDFKDAFHDLTQAMTGGQEAIDKFLEKYPVLSDAERKNIDDMLEQGNVSEARRVLYEKFAAHMDDAAAKGGNGGEWSNAWINLKTVFNSFLDYLGNAPIVIGGTITSLHQLKDATSDALIGLNYLLLRAQGFTYQQAGQAAVNGGGRAPIKPGSKPNGGRGPAGTLPSTTPLGQRAIRDAQLDALPTKDQSKVQRGNVAYQKAYTAALDKSFSAQEANTLATIARTKAERDFQDTADKRGAAAGRKADAAARRDANAAKALAARIQSQSDSLENALDQMGAKVAKVAAGNLQEQLGAAATAVELQYKKLFTQVDEFSKLSGGKGKIGGRSIADYRQQLTANEAILTQQAQLKVYEDAINATLKERQALLKDIEDKAARGSISAADAIRQTQEVTSKYDPLIQSLVDAATTFATKIGGANPSAELKAFLAKIQNIGQANAGTDQATVRDSAQKNINREFQTLNDILAQRNSLVESYNTMQELGLITADQARQKSAEAYNASQKAITAQIAVIRQALDAAKAIPGALDPQAFDAFTAQLDVIGQQANYLDPRFNQLKSSIDGLITDNALAAIDRIGQAFDNLALGTLTVGGALREAAFAFLDFIGQTILGIAKLILQMIILDAVQKITGIPVGALLRLTGGGGGGLLGAKHNGGTIGSYSGGQQTTDRISFNPSTIAGIPRYHDGTPSVGLKSNEQLSVLEKGEKVVTEEQQRLESSRKKASGSSGGGLRQVLAFGDDQVAAAMAGPAGENVTVTHIRRNVPLLKQMLKD